MTSWQAAGLVVGFAGAVLIFTPWRTASGLVSAGGLERGIALVLAGVALTRRKTKADSGEIPVE